MAVVTGQQPVLFTGPLFSIFKAISAIKIASSLEQAGINAVPVFWVAAEDHDFEEISSTWVLNRNSELCRLASISLRVNLYPLAGLSSRRMSVPLSLNACRICRSRSSFTELQAYS